MTDRIVTHPSNDAYRSGYDAIFGQQRKGERQEGETKRNEPDSKTTEVRGVKSLGGDTL